MATFGQRVAVAERDIKHLRRDVDENRADIDNNHDDIEAISTGFEVFKAEVRTAARLGSLLGAAIGSLMGGLFVAVIGGLVVAAMTHHL